MWFAHGSSQMPERVAERVIMEGAYVSVLTPLELSIKERKHHLDFGIDYAELFSEHELTPLPLSFSAVEYFRSLPMIHRDPFDRMLISQALGEGLTLATCDADILDYDVKTFW